MFHVKHTCSRCGAEHNRIGQNYCYACHAQANRDYRERQRKLRARMALSLAEASLSLAGKKPAGAGRRDLLALFDHAED